MKTCKHCGQLCDDDALFCLNCGQPLEEAPSSEGEGQGMIQPPKELESQVNPHNLEQVETPTETPEEEPVETPAEAPEEEPTET